VKEKGVLEELETVRFRKNPFGVERPEDIKTFLGLIYYVFMDWQLKEGQEILFSPLGMYGDTGFKIKYDRESNEYVVTKVRYVEIR